MIAVELHQLMCVTCGIQYGFPLHIFQVWSNSAKKWYCPNGCLQWINQALLAKTNEQETKFRTLEEELRKEQAFNKELRAVIFADKSVEGSSK